MLGGLFKKKDNMVIPEMEKKVVETEKKQPEEPELKIVNNEVKHDFDTSQCIDIGFDFKEDVRKSTRAFFNSRNKTKAEAYLKFEEYLETLSSEKIKNIQHMKYLDFKDKEEQMFTMLRNGFGQFLSKGATLDEETRNTINMVFGDVKKLPSKGHRYWYYKIYMWQKRED